MDLNRSDKRLLLLCAVLISLGVLASLATSDTSEIEATYLSNDR